MAITGPTIGLTVDTDADLTRAATFGDVRALEFQLTKSHADLAERVEGHVISTDPLKAVQESATTWQKTLTTILGLLGLGSILGRDKVQALGPFAMPVVIGGLVVAIGAAAIALFLVTKASASLPALVFVREKHKTDEVAITAGGASSNQKAVVATRNLRTSLAWAAGSLIASLVTVSVLWGAPDAKPSKTVQLTVKTGTTISAFCGEVTYNATDKTLTVKPGEAQAKESTYAFDRLVGIGPC